MYLLMDIGQSKRLAEAASPTPEEKRVWGQNVLLVPGLGFPQPLGGQRSMGSGTPEFGSRLMACSRASHSASLHLSPCMRNRKWQYRPCGGALVGRRESAHEAHQMPCRLGNDLVNTCFVPWLVWLSRLSSSLQGTHLGCGPGAQHRWEVL